MRKFVPLVKRCYLAITLLILFTCSVAQSKPLVRVAVSANFSAAFKALKPELEAFCECEITHTFGASGILASQFDNGAPFDMFLSADSDKSRWLYQRGRTLFAPQTYTVGQLVLLDKHRQQLSPENIGIPTQSNKKWRIAIANPATAPYGVAAEKILEQRILPENVEVVRGNSVLQAFQFLLTGNADQAIVAKSLLDDPVKQRFATLTLTHDMHPPIVQQMVVNRRLSEPLAQRLLAFFTLHETQKTLSTWGYTAISGVSG